jgi:hypothetical protein
MKNQKWYRNIVKGGLTLIAILLLNTGFVSTCKAQAMYIVLIFGDKIATEQFHLTIDAGLNITGMPGLDGTKNLVGLYYGMGTFIKLSDKWALTPEFKPLSQRGARNVTPILEYPGIADAKYKLRLNYIDVPVLLQYKISPKIYISGGPQIGFMVSAKQIVEGNTVEEGRETKATVDVKDSFNKIYYSIPLEFGMTLPKVLGKTIEFKARYCIGLNEVIADESYGSSRYRMWQVMLSLPFVKSAK